MGSKKHSQSRNVTPHLILNKDLMSTYWFPGTVLGSGNKAENGQSSFTARLGLLNLDLFKSGNSSQGQWH